MKANFPRKIEEALNQIDSMILDGDYWTNREQMKEMGEWLERWARVHKEHVKVADELGGAREL